jgi:quercetin dioxygenase-like cupin family protein
MGARVLVPPVAGSPLALRELEASGGAVVCEPDADSLLYVVSGTGALELGGARYALESGAAALVLAGEEGRVDGEGLTLLHATVGPDAERHAPLGPRAVVAVADEAESATGARSFRLLLGPHNGSTRATLFVGLVPLGAAPRHYHLYDEIVWIPEGPGRLHLGGSVRELGPGAAFRLRPREEHVVENAGETELAVLGVLTPAGSPAAAYLAADVAAEYRFAG